MPTISIPWNRSSPQHNSPVQSAHICVKDCCARDCGWPGWCCLAQTERYAATLGVGPSLATLLLAHGFWLPTTLAWTPICRACKGWRLQPSVQSCNKGWQTCSRMKALNFLACHQCHLRWMSRLLLMRMMWQEPCEIMRVDGALGLHNAASLSSALLSRALAPDFEQNEDKQVLPFFAGRGANASSLVAFNGMLVIWGRNWL